MSLYLKYNLQNVSQFASKCKTSRKTLVYLHDLHMKTLQESRVIKILNEFLAVDLQ